MDRGSMVKVSLLVAGVLLIAACGKAPGASIGPDRFAVVDWQRAERSHPEYKKLEQGEQILKDLLEKRKAQEALAKAHHGCKIK